MRGKNGQGTRCPQTDEAGATGEAPRTGHAESEAEDAPQILEKEPRGDVVQLRGERL